MGAKHIKEVVRLFEKKSEKGNLYPAITTRDQLGKEREESLIVWGDQKAQSALVNKFSNLPGTFELEYKQNGKFWNIIAAVRTDGKDKLVETALSVNNAASTPDYKVGISTACVNAAATACTGPWFKGDGDHIALLARVLMATCLEFVEGQKETAPEPEPEMPFSDAEGA